MRRREVLRTMGAVSIGGGALTANASAGDADPRPEPYAGEVPNENVPVTKVDPLLCGTGLGEQNHVVPVGDWIRHQFGFVNPDRDELIESLNQTTTTFIINGERFVLDSADDWDEQPQEAPEGFATLFRFEYETPPKPEGTTYDFLWQTVSADGEFLYGTPVSPEIRVVKRKDAVSDCTGEELA